MSDIISKATQIANARAQRGANPDLDEVETLRQQLYLAQCHIENLEHNEAQTISYLEDEYIQAMAFLRSLRTLVLTSSPHEVIAAIDIFMGSHDNSDGVL